MKENAAHTTIAQAENEELKGKYLTFWTEGQLFGIPIAEVVQIVGVQDITTMPDYPAYMKGIIHLRGSVIPLMDVRLRLGREEAEYTDRTCIIITNICDRYFGLIVDGVDEVTHIEETQITEPPQMGSESEHKYLTGVATLENGKDKSEKIILCMDVTKLLGENVLAALMAKL